jgi:hypothetical protein
VLVTGTLFGKARHIGLALSHGELLREVTMAGNYRIEFMNKTPFQGILGTPFCIWCYRLSWTGNPDELENRVALAFSSKVDIRDPMVYPTVQVIQGTTLAKGERIDQQYVIRERTAGTAKRVTFCFLAPCAEDTFTPLRLATAPSASTDWTFVPFTIDDDGPPALSQVIRGPAIAISVSTSATAGLVGATRRIAKATHVPLNIPGELPPTGRAMPKFAFVNQLALQPGEVDAVRRELQANEDHPLWGVLRSFEGAPIGSQ